MIQLDFFSFWFQNHDSEFTIQNANYWDISLCCGNAEVIMLEKKLHSGDMDYF